MVFGNSTISANVPFGSKALRPSMIQHRVRNRSVVRNSTSYLGIVQLLVIHLPMLLGRSWLPHTQVSISDKISRASHRSSSVYLVKHD